MVVMENLSSHKGQTSPALIEEAGAILHYLPPYSPDINPIEDAFAKLKALLRKAAERPSRASGRRSAGSSKPSPHPSAPTTSSKLGKTSKWASRRFASSANAASMDISERAELRPYSSALVEFAMRVLDGRVWCPVVELARILGFDQDGLAYQDVSGSWFVVSTPRFEQETGFAVRSRAAPFRLGCPSCPRTH